MIRIIGKEREKEEEVGPRIERFIGNTQVLQTLVMTEEKGQRKIDKIQEESIKKIEETKGQNLSFQILNEKLNLKLKV